MKTLMFALAVTTLLASPALARPRHAHDHNTSLHHLHARVADAWTWDQPAYRLLPPLVSPSQGHPPAGTTYHPNAPYGAPPMRTGTWALSQTRDRYQPVDSYDVVRNGRVIGRDPDPNIRFQILRDYDSRYY